jgi:hypothetical protein
VMTVVLATVGVALLTRAWLTGRSR